MTGTDRISEASKKIKKYIINVQADEIFLDPENIINVCKEIKKRNTQLLTVLVKLQKKRISFLSRFLK